MGVFEGIEVTSDRANTKAWKALMIRLGFVPDEARARVRVHLVEGTPARGLMQRFAGPLRDSGPWLSEVHDLGMVFADRPADDASTEEYRFATGDRHILVPWHRVELIDASVRVPGQGQET